MAGVIVWMLMRYNAVFAIKAVWPVVNMISDDWLPFFVVCEVG